MGASKKQRGKQCKAAKSKAAEGGIDINISDQVSPTKFVTMIQRGHDAATAMYFSGDYNLSRVQTDKVVTSVLGFLQRCEREAFDNVLADLGGDLFGADLGGDLRSPSLWINSLFKSDSSYIVQIAKNIGPLLNCMCDDKKMLFFQSNRHWMESLKSFTQLIWHIVDGAARSDDPLKHEAITVLIGHKGLVRSIVHWASFWYKGSCPHLFDKIGMDDYTLIHNCGKVSTRLLVEDRASLRETIGAMQISLPENDIVSFVVGLIRRIKIQFEQDYLSTLHHLIVDGDCVDKSVIVEMIDFGINSVEYEEATLVANHMFSMLYQGTVVSEQYLSDARVAFAIREGLIQMCLTFMERFGDQISNQNDIRTKLFSYVEGIFNAVHDVALHKKSWKAIRHVRLDIEERLDHLDAIIIYNVKCKKLLDVIKSIVDMNGAHCCHCNKSLGRKERYQCGDCNRMTYCSRACQRSDWLNGHNLACCKTITTDNKIGQFQGRLLPITIPSNERDASKLKELEINNNMIQLKVFLDHSSTILEQAKTLNIPLFDCIVKFDLCCCPPEITTLHYSECYSNSQKHYEASRSTKNITCLYYSFNFIGDAVATSHLDQDIATLLAVQRLFPCEWLTQKK